MELLNERYHRQEKINGVIYNMSPAPHYRHGIINSNIHTIINNGLKDSLSLVFMENLDYMYHPKENDDYVCPDIMIICDRKHLRGGSYHGVPKFIVETLSPSTVKKDRCEKKDIYESAGVDEYWIISPQERALEIYYLENNKYVLKNSYILQDNKEDDYYNAETAICLKSFPNIKMQLKDIFHKVHETYDRV